MPLTPLTALPPITLHLGAHRTGTGSVQALLERDATGLRAHGVAVWTPKRTRSGLMTGIVGDPGRAEAHRDLLAHRAAGRIALRRQAMAGDGVGRLVISDAAMLGGLRENLLLARLYPTAAARLARLAEALPGVDRICLSVRSPEAWWGSAFASLMARGFPPPDRATLDAVLRARRGWREVIEDVAGAFPGARVIVWTHEETAARPAETALRLTGHAADAPAPRRNAAPAVDALRARLRDEGCATDLPELGGAYAPFSPDERVALRDAHAATLAWLRAGADGLAEFETRRPDGPPPRDRKGPPDGGRERPEDALDEAGRGGAAG